MPAKKTEKLSAKPQMYAILEENGNITIEFQDFAKFVPRVRERMIVAMENKWAELQAVEVNKRRQKERRAQEEERRQQKLIDNIGPRALTSDEATLLLGKEA